MILKRLYTEPTELFPTVEFQPGLNFIYGIKDKPQDTLNGIGKSLFLDFLDFALLSYFNHSANTRLNRAFRKNIITNHIVILEFEINNVAYSISRSFEDPDNAILYKNNKQVKAKNILELRKELNKLVFSRKTYHGVIEEIWFRDLIKFYLKIQKVADEKFTDPLRFITKKEIQLNIYHLFLLNIDNSMLVDNLYLNKEIDDYDRTIKTTKQFLRDHYNIKDIARTANTITGLNTKITNLKKKLDNYKLDSEYDLMNNRINKITEKIKNLLFLVSLDEKNKNELSSPVKANSKIISSSVVAIYSELNPDFKNVIKKTIDEAVAFRSELENSRSDFIAYQKSLLDVSITLHKREIEQLTSEQTKLFKELANKDALKDLNSAHQTLNDYINEKRELESKVDFYKDLLKNKTDLHNANVNLLNQVDDFIASISDSVSGFASLLGGIYSNIFNTPLENEFFSINKSKEKEKIKFSILPDDIYSHGKNQGRTLVYDLAVLFNSIEQNINAPRFLVHDGIFDSLDTTHLANLIQFCNKKVTKDFNFQYIVTLNQQESLHKEILKQSVLKIYSTNKLLGSKF
ncbi:MAG: DUF2326 domain-containing protein [Ignavibacteriaceae bacterium]